MMRTKRAVRGTCSPPTPSHRIPPIREPVAAKLSLDELFDQELGELFDQELGELFDQELGELFDQDLSMGLSGTAASTVKAVQ
ncbi:hypothetical protein [Cryobacterium lyxosi]|uniref:hypothetical protein n=1 Tax=Cryobacterium lyxosi TaxID=1259228 RepID=UPI00141B678E|nr:hypothetical protein [Cryobacterium lyxosi]